VIWDVVFAVGILVAVLLAVTSAPIAAFVAPVLWGMRFS